MHSPQAGGGLSLRSTVGGNGSFGIGAVVANEVVDGE